MAKAHLKTAAAAPAPAVAKFPDAPDRGEREFRLRACAVLLLAALLRLLWLGQAIYHPDEAIHALESYNFLDYHFDPVYHGPLLYHLEALTLHALGDNDFTARLVPALLGIGVVAMALFSAGRWMGRSAALWSAGLLALSPVMVAYSRRILHDSLVLALTLGAVLYFQTARENSTKTWEGREARVGVVLLLTLFLATKANAFFIIAMLAAYWVTLWLRPKVVDEGAGRFFLSGLPLVLYGFVAIAAHFALRGGDAEQHNEHLLLLICFLCCGALWMWLCSAERDGGEARGQLDFWTPVLAIGLSSLVFAFLFGRGFLWLRDGITPDSRQAVLSAMPRMLQYWRGQQGHPRLPGPHDYYIVLALMYELPIVVAGAFGIWRASRVRTSFTDLLLWWCFTSFAVYALANEKVPWLLTHQILPLALLGGVWLGSLRPSKWLWVGTAAGAVFLMRNVAATSFGRPGDMHEPLYYAQTTDTFGDSFRAAMNKAVWNNPTDTGAIWLESSPNAFSPQWPGAWYIRHSGRAKAPPNYDAAPDANHTTQDTNFRLAVMRPEVWEDLRMRKFAGWRTWYGSFRNSPGIEAEPDFLVWQRCSWPALRPDRYVRWWLHREATQENGVLAEWSSTAMVVATRK